MLAGKREMTNNLCSRDAKALRSGALRCAKPSRLVGTTQSAIIDSAPVHFAPPPPRYRQFLRRRRRATGRQSGIPSHAFQAGSRWRRADRLPGGANPNRAALLFCRAGCPAVRVQASSRERERARAPGRARRAACSAGERAARTEVERRKAEDNRSANCRTGGDNPHPALTPRRRGLEPEGTRN